MPSESGRATGVRRYCPKLAQLSDRVLFDDIWQRPALNPRERSLITVAALVALNRVEQLPFHLQLAQRNGVTRQQLAELITHLAFYAGWPGGVGRGAPARSGTGGQSCRLAVSPCIRASPPTICKPSPTACIKRWWRPLSAADG